VVRLRPRHRLPQPPAAAALPHQPAARPRQPQYAIFAAERRQDISLTRGYNPYFFGAARAWCKGTALADILAQVDISEGDLVSTFNKTLDIMRQVRDMLAATTLRTTC
jgi:superfamily II RNA helicase